MNKKFIKPDFNNNVVNISATLAEFLGCKTDKGTLPILKNSLSNSYKNVVFIIFDGLGINPININLDETSFIKQNIKQILTSTFPSTTTNATTSLLTAKYPLEHGWLGWSVYFKELNRAVNIYLNDDTYTGERIDPIFVKNRLPIEPYYKAAKSDYKINKVVPEYWTDGIDNNKYIYEDIDEMFSKIDKVCKEEGKQFIYSYCGEPDHIMHNYGVSSIEAKNLILDIDSNLEKLTKENKDSLFIVTADHGQVDIDGYIELYKDEEINSLLKWPPSLEPRAAAFKVKKGYKEKFKKMFNERYGKDFVLYESEYLIKEGYFGNIDSSNKELLGDFIGVCFTNKLMLFSEDSNRFKGHHTSLTKEMEVPLIIINNKR